MTMPDTVIDGLTITLFGPMQVLVQGQPLPHLRSRKALWLLALLTLRHGRPVEREWLAGTLWPDMDQSQAFANLRPILSDLRRVLGSQGKRLQSPDRNTVLLDLAGAEVDLLLFDAAIGSRQLPDHERGVALYRGPLLEGCNEEWAHQERAAREQNCLQALQKLADAALAAGNHRMAIHHYQRAVSIDPWWDSARRGWMEALAKSGDTNAALQVYREFVDVLKSDPKAVPDEQTSALYQRLRSDARQQTRMPAVVAMGTAVTEVQGYLPHPLSDLIGREDERVEVAFRLRRFRLVTLKGMGGIGKTRLALAVAADVVKDYPDGVWLVALEAVAEGKIVIQQIASVLGVRESPGRSLLHSVIDRLRTKRLLLVLDNCEHLLQASAQAASYLLQECAEVQILATSREALGITGEAIWAVPTLATPDLQHLPQGSATLLRVVMSYESVQLFMERAQAVQKTFTLSRSNARLVAEVCSRLEGVPLAIELAAARMKAMTVEQVATRLDNHLSLLTGGSRTALSRQQTLRATLDWSYTLLLEVERVLLSRLSVFAGGWSLAAAEEICAGEGMETSQILDTLTSLVDKSLVMFEELDPETGWRYRLLEVVRQYAIDRLKESGETGRIKSRHRDWYLVLAQAANKELEMSLRQLETEHNNLRAALIWCETETAGAEKGLQLGLALWGFWMVRGYYDEGRKYLGRALERNEVQGAAAIRAQALNRAGSLTHRLGDHISARIMIEESLSIQRQLGDRRGIALTLNSLANVNHALGDYALVRSQYEESLNLFKELGYRKGIAWSLTCLGILIQLQGENIQAQALFEQSLSIRRELGEKLGIAVSLGYLGNAIHSQGDYARAQALYEESLSICEELGDRPGIAASLCRLGKLASNRGEYSRAQMLFEKSLSIFTELGNRPGIAVSLNGLGSVAYGQSEYTTGQSRYEESLRIFTDLNEKPGIAVSLNGMGNVARSQGKLILARTLYGESLAIRHAMGYKEEVAESLEGLAAVMLAQAETRNAVHLWGVTHVLRATIASPLPPIELARHDHQVKQARRALGEEVFTTCWEESRAMSWKQTVVSALKDRE